VGVSVMALGSRFGFDPLTVLAPKGHHLNRWSVL
jgi:hypothetical protein